MRDRKNIVLHFEYRFFSITHVLFYGSDGIRTKPYLNAEQKAFHSKFFET